MRTATSSAEDDVDASAARTRGRRRRLIVGGGLAVVAATAAFVFLYFQPQKLFVDDHVNEPFPVAAPPTSMAASPARAAPTTVHPSSPAPDSPTPAPSLTPTTSLVGPVPERSGSFVSRDHGTSGMATIYQLDDGRRVLRIEDLDTSNGPALFVYLSANPAAGPEGAFDDTYVDLGSLKGNVGDQNYEVPAGVDVANYTSVVIWCDRFDAAFGAADLS